MDIVERVDQFILPKLEKIPYVSMYAKTRGWPFVLAWLHRIAGVLLVLYIFFHIYTLSGLLAPERFDAKMRILRLFFFVLLEWALAIPVIFHALNGGRLILYETFGNRNTVSVIRWVLGLGSLYVVLTGMMMAMGNQSVTPVFFWLFTVAVAFCVGYQVVIKIRSSDATWGWKLQRISGAFLMVMIPAHLLFMHLNPSIGHDATVVIARMQNIFIKLIDLSLIFAILFHAGYGIYSITKDYISKKSVQLSIGFLIVLVMVIFGWTGIKLTLTI